MADVTGRIETHRVFDIDIEVERRGKGAPLVLLYDEEALTREAPLVDALARSHEVILPSPPGFGRSGRPGWIETVDDVSYVLLDLFDELGIADATVMGFSLGGWIAAEMGTKTCAHMARLVLVDPYGIKVGGPFDRDIQDIWYLPADKVLALKYADPENGRIDYTQMPDDRLEIVARNRESFARFCWSPYLHNPRLKARLHRIAVPTLVVWGANDGIVTPDYGKAFAAEIPGARFETIARAGHFPHLEQPDAFMKLLDDFLAEARSAA